MAELVRWCQGRPDMRIKTSSTHTGNDVTRVVIPFKDQDSGDIVKAASWKTLALSSKPQSSPCLSFGKLAKTLKNGRPKSSWLINSVWCTSLNVTCVIQGAMLATRTGIYMSPWMAIKTRHLQYTSTMTMTMQVLSLRTSLAVSKFSRNAWTNSIVLSMRCFT